jgi:hypothetical protein
VQQLRRLPGVTTNCSVTVQQTVLSTYAPTAFFLCCLLQKSAVIRTTELCVTDVINELSNSPSQTEIFVETPSQTLNTVDEPDGLSGKPGSSVVSSVANVPSRCS